MLVDTIFLYQGKDYFAIICDCGNKFDLEAGENWVEAKQGQLARCPKCHKEQLIKDMERTYGKPH